MLPGPYQLPPLPQLPFYINPFLLWALILLAAVLLAVTFFRFIFAEPAERVNNFFVFFLALIFILGIYLIFMNADTIGAFFHQHFSQIFKRR